MFLRALWLWGMISAGISEFSGTSMSTNSKASKKRLRRWPLSDVLMDSWETVVLESIKPNRTRSSSLGRDKDSPRGTHVASICTDLWWYSIVDYDEFKRRGCEGEYSDAQLVSTKPGVYRFTHYNTYSASYQKPHVYAKIEWVRDPDPVKDYASVWDKQNFTAGQVIAISIEKYPTLYGGPDGVRRVAEHILCVIGGGGDWHENGFLLYDPELSSDQEDVQIPLFDGAYDWYPMCRYSNLCRAAGIGDYEIKLNPSFLALAYNVANCIVKHGSIKHPENVEIAKRCIEGLNKKYGQVGSAEMESN